MSIFDHPEFDLHEQVIHVCDDASGLRGILAIHRTTKMMGASGGCRMWPYASEDEALWDALRLSRMMSYKLAIAEVPLGGAKFVIIGDPERDKSEALLRAIGRTVNRLNGRYVTGADVGFDHDDLKVMGQETRFLLETDAAESTSYGVFVAIKAAVAHRLGRRDLKGLKVAVQGVGRVGYLLCQYLREAGAELVVADLEPEEARRAEQAFGARVVAPDAIYDVEAEVYSPCALGATLNDETIPHLKCSVIAGAANNQLAEPRHGELLMQRGILHAPDFAVNGGGAISLGQRAVGAKVDLSAIDRVADILGEVFTRAESEGVPTEIAAERIAQRRARYLVPGRR